MGIVYSILTGREKAGGVAERYFDRRFGMLARCPFHSRVIDSPTRSFDHRELNLSNSLQRFATASGGIFVSGLSGALFHAVLAT